MNIPFDTKRTSLADSTNTVARKSDRKEQNRGRWQEAVRASRSDTHVENAKQPRPNINVQDLLEIPSNKASQNTFPPGCIVSFAASSPPFETTLAVVRSISIDLGPNSKRDFVYYLMPNDSSEPIYAYESELRLGYSCPVWVRPLHSPSEQSGEIAAVVIGCYEHSDGHVLYSVHDSDLPNVKYHGIPAFSIRFRSIDTSGPPSKPSAVVQDAGHDDSQARKRKISDSDESTVDQKSKLAKTDTSGTSTLDNAEIRGILSSVVRITNAQANVQAPCSVGSGKVSQTMFFPSCIDQSLLSSALVGVKGRVHKQLEENFQCEIALSTKQTPTRVVVTGLEPNVVACMQDMQRLLAISVSGHHRPLLLFKLAEMNSYVHREGQVFYQCQPDDLSRMIWLYVMDISGTSKKVKGRFIGKNGSGLIAIEQQTGCRITARYGTISYVLITGDNPRATNECVDMVQKNLCWAEEKTRLEGDNDML